MNNLAKNSAFTLVELAIVIIIIGLLVGGVLTGKELIKQAKIKSQISQFSGYDTATMIFKEKFGNLPADIPGAKAISFGLTVNTANENPNGNNMINDSNDRVPPLSSYDESFRFFLHLRQKDLIKDLNKTQSGNYSVGLRFPFAELGGGVAAISHRDGLYWFLGPTITNDTTSAAAFNLNSDTPPISPEYASMMEEKLDDGIPSQGRIRAIIVTSSVSTNFNNDATLNSCLGATNQVYNLNNSTPLCRLIVKSKVD